MPARGSVNAMKGPPHSMISETQGKPIRRTFFVADLKCYMCGTVCGSIESEQSLTVVPNVPRPALLRQSGLAQPVQILNWRHMRCDRCGGPLFLDEQEVVTRRYEEYN